MFEGGRRVEGEEDRDREREQLHAKIGELSVNVDFLKKNPSKDLYLDYFFC